MNEVTRILTLQITVIDKKGEWTTQTKDAWAEDQAQIVKDDWGADDVVVLGVQDFIREEVE